MTTSPPSFTGQCACKEVVYELKREPMFVNCCHCTWCQRESGSAFALNALIESSNVKLIKGKLEIIDTPSNSGQGQRYFRCAKCKVALWSEYNGAGDKIKFIRAGTLTNANAIKPNAHIFTSTKLDWVKLDDNIPQFENYYKAKEVWSEASQKRRADAT